MSVPDSEAQRPRRETARPASYKEASVPLPKKKKASAAKEYSTEEIQALIDAGPLQINRQAGYKIPKKIKLQVIKISPLGILCVITHDEGPGIQVRIADGKVQIIHLHASDSKVAEIRLAEYHFNMEPETLDVADPRRLLFMVNYLHRELDPPNQYFILAIPIALVDKVKQWNDLGVKDRDGKTLDEYLGFVPGKPFELELMVIPISPLFNGRRPIVRNTGFDGKPLAQPEVYNWPYDTIVVRSGALPSSLLHNAGRGIDSLFPEKSDDPEAEDIEAGDEVEEEPEFDLDAYAASIDLSRRQANMLTSIRVATGPWLDLKTLPKTKKWQKDLRTGEWDNASFHSGKRFGDSDTHTVRHGKDSGRSRGGTSIIDKVTVNGESSEEEVELQDDERAEGDDAPAEVAAKESEAGSTVAGKATVVDAEDPDWTSGSERDDPTDKAFVPPKGLRKAKSTQGRSQTSTVVTKTKGKGKARATESELEADGSEEGN